MMQCTHWRRSSVSARRFSLQTFPAYVQFSIVRWTMQRTDFKFELENIASNFKRKCIQLHWISMTKQDLTPSQILCLAFLEVRSTQNFQNMHMWMDLDRKCRHFKTLHQVNFIRTLDICTCWLHFDNKSGFTELVLTLQAQFLGNCSFTFKTYSDFGKIFDAFIFQKATNKVISWTEGCQLFNDYKVKTELSYHRAWFWPL